VVAADTNPEVITFAGAGGMQYEKLGKLLPGLDAAIRQMKGIETFAEAVARYEDEHVRTMLETAISGGSLPRDADLSNEGVRALLERGKATRMFALVTIGNTYRRAKVYLEEKRQARAAGSLSDTRLAAESAYCDAVVTNDDEFLEVGKLINQV